MISLRWSYRARRRMDSEVRPRVFRAVTSAASRLVLLTIPLVIGACSDAGGAGPGGETPSTSGSGSQTSGGGGTGGAASAAGGSQNAAATGTGGAAGTAGGSQDAAATGTGGAGGGDGGLVADDATPSGSDANAADARTDGAPVDSGGAGHCPTTGELETLLGIADTSYYANNNVPHGNVTSVFYDWPAANNPRGAGIPQTSQQGRSPEVPVGQERMSVYTPPGYETGTDRYPVLYLNHGTTDTDKTWLCTATTTDLPSCGYAGLMLDNLIAAAKAVKMIIVTPYIDDCGTLDPPAASTIKDTFACTPKYKNAIIPKIDSAYRTIADRHGRAIAGLSRGGYVTLETGVPNVDTLFSEFYVFSAAYGAPASPDLNGYKTALGAILTDSATTNRLLDVPVYVAIGMTDNAILGNATTMMAMFNTAGVKTLYQNSTGGHEWGNWRRYLHQTLQLMFKNSTGCP